MSKKLVRLLAALLALSLIAAACGDDDSSASPEPAAPAPAPEPMPDPEPAPAPPEPEEPGTIVDVAVAAGSFPTLVAAVQAAGLVDTLSSEGPFTVFAPTEDAFAAALAALGISAEELLADTDLLTAVLTYHVLPLEAPAEVVLTLDGESVTTVNGADITISIDGDTVKVNDSNVITTDITASNGIIHVIDAVLLPPSPEPEPADEPEPEPEAAPEPEPEEPGTIVDVAVESGQFPTLIAAVQAAGLVDTLSGEGPFTVFAPTEDAFAAALTALDLTAADLLANTDLLTAVLTYHVLPLAAPAELVLTLDGESVTTVNGADITISIDGDTVKVNDSNVITTDITASNGIIHVIDAVLLPPSPEPEPADEPESEEPGTIVDVAVESGQFPTLVAAIEAAGLVETLSGEGPFTVFAPTEDAFAAALEVLGMPLEALLGVPPLLTSVLTYHVLPIEAPAELVLTLDGESVTTVHGADITISIDGDTVKLNDVATVVATDIPASNGIIHVIDTVLIRDRE